LSEKQALEESKEKKLLDELWAILSRKQPKKTTIKILNLKTIVTALLGFSIMVVDSKQPYAGKVTHKKTSKRHKSLYDS
jgi:hypothetical protein